VKVSEISSSPGCGLGSSIFGSGREEEDVLITVLVGVLGILDGFLKSGILTVGW